MRIAIHCPIHERKNYGYDFVYLLIGSLILQTYRQWSLYLIDDACGRFDWRYARNKLAEMGLSLPPGARIEYHKYGNSSDVHVVPDKRNYAIRETIEPIIVNMDDDDYKYPIYLAEVAKYFETMNNQYNFSSWCYTYDLINSRWKGPDLCIGSSQWFFRRQWYLDNKLKYDGIPGKRNGSDKKFLWKLKIARAAKLSPLCTGVFNKSVILWHESNVINRRVTIGNEDRDHQWLHEKFDRSLLPVLHEIIQKTSPSHAV